MPDHFDELDDDQRARLCVLTQLYEELGPLEVRDLLQYSHWIVTGDDPNYAWRYAAPCQPAGTTDEIHAMPCTEPTSAEDDLAARIIDEDIVTGGTYELTTDPQCYKSSRWHPAVQ